MGLRERIARYFGRHKSSAKVETEAEQPQADSESQRRGHGRDSLQQQPEPQPTSQPRRPEEERAQDQAQDHGPDMTPDNHQEPEEQAPKPAQEGLPEGAEEQAPEESQQPPKDWFSGAEGALPLEMIMCINDFLDKADSISFSLSNHWIRAGLQSPIVAPGDKATSVAVLTRLSADRPGKYCCHVCGKLHKMDRLFHPATQRVFPYHACPEIGAHLRTQRGAPLKWAFFSVHQPYSDYTIRHHHVVSALKNHRTGDPGISVDCLAYTEIVNMRATPNLTTLLSIEARVCEADQRLVLQMQHWLLVHELSKTNKTKVFQFVDTLQVCAHENVAPVLGRDVGPDEFPNSSHLANPDLPEPMWHCGQCGVEWKWDFPDVGDDAYALVVTKWLDLGAGVELDDPQWRKITSYQRRRNPDPTEECEGVLRQLFQSAVVGDDGDPTERNKGYLVGKRYKDVVPTRNGVLYKGYGKLGTDLRPSWGWYDSDED